MRLNQSSRELYNFGDFAEDGRIGTIFAHCVTVASKIGKDDVGQHFECLLE